MYTADKKTITVVLDFGPEISVTCFGFVLCIWQYQLLNTVVCFPFSRLWDPGGRISFWYREMDRECNGMEVENSHILYDDFI